MLTKENINPCNNQIYSSSGIVGTTLTYHNDYNLNNSGAIGTTDIWYRTTKGTITCNLQNEGSLSNYNLALYKIDNEENSTLLFDAQYKDIGATSFIVNNLDNIEDHKRNHLYIEFRYGSTIKARFNILNVFESALYRVSFQSISRSGIYGSKTYIQLKDLRVERIRSFDNLYSTIANKTNIAVTAKSSNIGLGFFDGLQDTQQEITERKLAVNLMNGITVVQSLLNKTFEMNEDSYEVISFTTPSEIISSHYLRIITTRIHSGSSSPSITIQIPIHDGTNALLCPDCTYYICFNHSNQRVGTTTISEEEAIDYLSLSRYPFTKSIWQSIIEPIVINEDSRYLPAYNDIFTGSTGSTSGDSTQACLFKKNIAGVTGSNGCDIYIFQRSSGITIPMQTYIKVKPVATQTYVVGQAIRACDLLNEAGMYNPDIIT